MKILSGETVAWCVERAHPLVTYNPHLNSTWCRCGERIVQGDADVDWDAKWEIGHDHGIDEPCRCYLPDAGS